MHVRLLIRLLLVPLTGCSWSCTAAEDANNYVSQTVLAELPFPVSNNAVACIDAGARQYCLSFAGLGAGKGHSDTLDRTLILDSESGRWRESVPLPGGVGRLASVAASVGGLAYVFGGYTVEADGSEVSTPFVHSFNPQTDEFVELAAMPVPVDDTLAVTYRDRYIYLISGWHDLGNVNLVQRYDVETDLWVQATPIPGNTLFGHAGGIVDDKIVYCDGVMIEAHADRGRDFVMSDECFLGLIDESDSRRIDWRRIPSHPGSSRYRMAAAGIESMRGVLFIGGSENPYNYDGIGYNGEPSEPVGGGMFFALDRLSWRAVSIPGPATMDHRGLVHFGDHWMTVGGMLAGQEVTDRVIVRKLDLDF